MYPTYLLTVLIDHFVTRERMSCLGLDCDSHFKVADCDSIRMKMTMKGTLRLSQCGISKKYNILFSSIGTRFLESLSLSQRPSTNTTSSNKSTASLLLRGALEKSKEKYSDETARGPDNTCFAVIDHIQKVCVLWLSPGPRITH